MSKKSFPDQGPSDTKPKLAEEIDPAEIFEYSGTDYETVMPAGIAAMKADPRGTFPPSHRFTSDLRGET